MTDGVPKTGAQLLVIVLVQIGAGVGKSLDWNLIRTGAFQIRPQATILLGLNDIQSHPH